MEQDVIILSGSQWDMLDEQTGVHRRGTTIWYVPADMNPIISSDGTATGNIPAKASVEYDFLKEIIASGGAPVLARITFVMRTRANKPTLEVANVNIIGPLKEKKNG